MAASEDGAGDTAADAGNAACAAPIDPQAAAHACFADGVARMSAGDTDGAAQAFRDALACLPTRFAARINLGLLLAQHDAEAAADHYRAAIALDPLRVDGYLHFGALLAAQRRVAEAEYNYRQALAIAPADPRVLSNLGVLLACSGRDAQAAACYHAALAADPDYQAARFNLSYLLLRDGDWQAGWVAFEGRPWYRQFERYFDFPRWAGEALAGKSLMIAVEAGHGDMIQFCRYASLARQQGAVRVGLVCHAGLQRLFASLDGVDRVFGIDEEVPRTGWDYWTPPLSMPYRFRTVPATVPARLPYLAATAADIARLRHLTAAPPAMLRVGLAWQGNRRFDNDGERSIAALATLAPLASVAGVRFFSLQKDPREPAGPGATLADSFPGLRDLAPHLDDFADTAALIDGLDLVIAVDTAVAHLAGALGKPCWLLLPAYQPDWRWLKARPDSPWYPQVLRLFRQQRAGEWAPLVQTLRAELRQLVADRGGQKTAD